MFQELEKLDLFVKLLTLGSQRRNLHSLVQAVKDAGYPLQARLAEQLVIQLDDDSKVIDDPEKFVTTAMNCGSFFLDAGWYEYGGQIFCALKRRLERINLNKDRWHSLMLECSMKQLQALSSFCQFDEAQKCYFELLQMVHRGRHNNHWLQSHQLAACYSQFSSFCFVLSQYLNAYKWSMEALRLLNSDDPPRVVIDVLRQASKACVVRRNFQKADILIKQAVVLAKEVFGEIHPKYADCLADFGFYLLNVDSIAKSLQAYESALKVRN